MTSRHGWEIRETTRAIGELHGANVPMKIGDVITVQYFFIQDSAMHYVIPREPYTTLVRMEMKFLDNGICTCTGSKVKDNRGSVAFLIVQWNSEKNWYSLKSDN